MYRQEEAMSQATETVQVFKIGPEAVPSGHVAAVVRTDSQIVLAHVWEKGGETGLHSHYGSDATWVVIDGAVKFYGEGDTVMATLERGGGIYIPRNTKYWFESVAEEPLVMVRCAAKDKGVNDDRVYVEK
jgi:mannose-6-phosphate isomerase-like protein (cupin superfamily)